jgi:hypothetical protein
MMPGKKNKSLKHPSASEKLKNALKRDEGLSEDAAQEKAARLTNAGYGVKGGKRGGRKKKK